MIKSNGSLATIKHQYFMTDGINLNLSRIAIVCVQHILNTTSHLFHGLLDIGFKQQNLFISGKQYSTCPQVAQNLLSSKFRINPSSHLTQLGHYQEAFKSDIEKMWQQVKYQHALLPFEAIIILDDGGRCYEEFLNHPTLLSIPSVAIEQTTAGINLLEQLQTHFPVIDVACSAIKTFVEPEFLLDDLIMHLANKVDLNNFKQTFGIIGLGKMGKALASKLAMQGYKINTFDLRTNHQLDHPHQIVRSIEELMIKSDIIIGCTGRDTKISLDNIKAIDKNLTFISCSSEDNEFQQLLKEINKIKQVADPLRDIHFNFSSAKTLSILRGGFPINFDNNDETIAPNEIQLTRGLLFSAVIQALFVLQSRQYDCYQRLKLCPHLQKHVMAIWSHFTKYNYIFKNEHFNFSDADWIADHSAGFHSNENTINENIWYRLRKYNPSVQIAA